VRAGWVGLLVIASVLLPPALAQFPPDLGAVSGPLDPIAGQVVPPTLETVYNATGQNISREDVRLFLDLNFTKGDMNLFGLVIGSGKAEVQAHLHVRGELRVISSDRIRAAIEGENAYNMSTDNLTFLSDVYLTADMFRATLTAEAIALFQKAQEAALAQYLRESVPEMDVLSLEISWSNVTPQQAFTDTDITGPPIVVELDLVVQYIRIESVPSLVGAYLGSKDKGDGKKDYLQELKERNGAEPKERDFMGAAAYTQLLNLSMQPGWSLKAGLHVPRGYSFTYANHPVQSEDERSAAFEVDASDSDAEVKEVFLASITHRRAVALALFISMMVIGTIAAFVPRFLYVRYRLARLAAGVSSRALKKELRTPTG
jgi:hypothetical protein